MISRKLAGGVLAVSSVYAMDELYWYRTVRRSLRAGGVGVYTIFNYKVLWSPERASEINEKVARAITNCCLENEGLYVKIGQGLNSLAAVLPKEYTKNLTRLLDRAKTYDFATIERIIDAEIGPGVVRDVNPVPVGSASLAQVHKGILVQTGQPVAIKVQKPNVSMQAYWDMWVYKLLVRALEWSFDIPLYWAASYTTTHFMAELDFRLEGANSELAREQLHRLGDIVYVPRVFKSTEKLLITEWVEDTLMISEVEKLKARGYDCKRIVLDATEVFAFQIFKTGHVHCDPHFGNLLVREHPEKTGYHQVVLIDHGLYVELPETLRHDYARLWVAMTPPQDKATVAEICHRWGIGSIDLFQSIVRQGSGADKNVAGKHEHQKRNPRETGALVKTKLKELLQDTSRFPKELILVGRCMNYIRAANWTHGSPIDRVSVLVNSAKESLNEKGHNTGSKSWIISAATSLFRWAPGGKDYHKAVDSE